MRQTYFQYPFGNVGDQTAIPFPTQSNGSVSINTGWGQNYARNLATDTLALPIDRATTNWLFAQITGQIQQYQQYGVPEWITTINNGGTPFAYDFGAMVRYSSSGAPPFNTYISVLPGQATNTSVPGADANWRLINSGSFDKFSPGYSAAIGGYGLGAILEDNAGTSLYISTVANNTTDFNSISGATWIPFAGSAFGALYGALAGQNKWTGAQSSTPVAVTPVAGAVSINFNNGNNFVVAQSFSATNPPVVSGGLSANFTLGNITITSANYGQSGMIEFIQDATGGRTITAYSSAFLLPTVTPNLTATANRRDTLYYSIHHDGRISFSFRNNEG